MRNKPLAAALRAIFELACGGALFAGSCTSEELQSAILAGVETATDQLANASEDDEISFLDWINSELDD